MSEYDDIAEGLTERDSREPMLQPEENSPGPSRSVSSGREAAVARGRALGEDEANRRNETGEIMQERIRRAMAYAAWEFDGKPESSAAQRREFQVTDSPLTASMDRAIFGRLLKKGKT